jgi:hypothetical protein
MELPRQKKRPQVARRATQHWRQRSGPASMGLSVAFSDIFALMKFTPPECLILASDGIAMRGKATQSHGILARLYNCLLNDSRATAQAKFTGYK